MTRIAHPKRIVLIGGPGTGKSTLITELEQRGYDCMHEISRHVTLQAQKDGIEQLFLTEPLLFSQKLLEGRLTQFKAATNGFGNFLFYDRGLPDVPIYMDYLETEYPEHFVSICKEHRYDEVFLLPPWKAIYKQDNERYESFETATELYHFLKDGYQSYGYTPIEVPIGTVQERIHFIASKLQLPI